MNLLYSWIRKADKILAMCLTRQVGNLSAPLIKCDVAAAAVVVVKLSDKCVSVHEYVYVCPVITCVASWGPCFYDVYTKCREGLMQLYM